ncbi:MAG: SRPBCC family protein [Rhodothermales bacterium]
MNDSPHLPDLDASMLDIQPLERAETIPSSWYADVTSPEARKSIAEDIAFSDRVQEEDIEICEYVQRGLQSRAYDWGRFSVETEEGVYHFQCLLKQAYREAVV